MMLFSPDAFLVSLRRRGVPIRAYKAIIRAGCRSIDDVKARLADGTFERQRSIGVVTLRCLNEMVEDISQGEEALLPGCMVADAGWHAKLPGVQG